MGLFQKAIILGQGYFLFGFVLIGVLLICNHAKSNAIEAKQTSKNIKFLGFDIKKSEKFYIVKTEVNIRAAPKTKSKKLGTLKKLERIRVVGEAPGAWVAVEKKGKEVGFVYKPALLQIINGRLKKNIVGSVHLPNKPKCKYKIEYIGASSAEGQLFKIMDYGIEWDCRKKIIKRNTSLKSEQRKKSRSKKKNIKKLKFLKKDEIQAKFYTPMFLPEGVQGGINNGRYQVTIDFVDTPFGVDGVLSTTSFYNPKSNILEFGEVSVKSLESNLKKPKVKVKKINKILISTLEMAYAAWDNKIWDYFFLKP